MKAKNAIGQVPSEEDGWLPHPWKKGLFIKLVTEPGKIMIREKSANGGINGIFVQYIKPQET